MTKEEIIMRGKQLGFPRLSKKSHDNQATMIATIVKEAVLLERGAIAEEFWSCVMSDLEHGVKSLNEKASFDFQKNMPELSKFGRWLNERGKV